MIARRMLAYALTVAIAAAPAAAQTISMTPELAKVVADAKAEGKLSLRSAVAAFGGPEGAQRVGDAINKTFGTNLTVEWSPGPAYGPMAAILYQEFHAGQPASTDVYTASAVQITGYIDKGLFRRVDWHALMPQRVTAQMSESEGRALRFQTVLQGLLYNVKAAPWAPAILTTEDFLKPQYKGKFYTTPFLGGFDVMLADDVWGVDKTTAYIKKFVQQIGGLAGCEAMDRIASGEIPALYDCTGGATKRAQYRGTGILDYHVISDMAQKRENYLAVPVNAQHPNAAILFSLFMMTHEGQERFVYDLYGNDLSDFPDSHIRGEIDALATKGVSFVDVTTDWWRKHAGLDAANAALAKLIRDR
jgi:ABC-type Fe3+ transport system substrate-binding protein